MGAAIGVPVEVRTAVPAVSGEVDGVVVGTMPISDIAEGVPVELLIGVWYECDSSCISFLLAVAVGLLELFGDRELHAPIASTSRRLGKSECRDLVLI